MVIIDRYIRVQVIKTTLLVALALIGFDYFFNLVQELKIVGRGHYSIVPAFNYLLLTLPSRLYALFPWVALMGSLLSLGSLANRSELVVMRTGGLSVLRITESVLKGGLILTMGMVLLGEGVAPFLDKLADTRRLRALSGGQSMQTNEGLWIKQGYEFIHIDKVKNTGELLGVTRYQLDEHYRLKGAIFARHAQQISKGAAWRLSDIQGTRFLNDKTEVFKKDSEEVVGLVEPQILETAQLKHPERLPLWSLWRTIAHRSKHQLNTQSYELAWWSKIFQPLVIIMMIFLGASFVFGPLRSGSTGLRLLIGLLMGFAFHTLNHLFAPLALMYQWPPLVAVFCPFIVFGLLGTILIGRVR